MTKAQRDYFKAKATYETTSAKARESWPIEPSDGADEAAWEAYYEAQEVADEAAGVYAAREAFFRAEDALIVWGATLPAVKQAGLDVADLLKGRNYDLRCRFVDIVSRAA